MLDIRLIRSQPDLVKQAMRDLGSDVDVDALLGLDARRREAIAEAEKLKNLRNTTSEEINRLRKARQPADDKIAEMRQVGDRIGTLDDEIRQVEAELHRRLAEVPNLPDPAVPVGPDESANVLLRQEGTPRAFDFEPKPHWELGTQLGLIEFERGVRMSGSRFYVLKGAGARLQRGLIQWLLDLHTTEHRYTEIYPPFMVKEECVWNAGQLPRFRDNVYHDADEDFWWIGTAEVPLTNLHAGEVIDLDQLPLRYTAYTPCFRREKMSAGRDVRGIKRGHQFDKVEQYAVCAPETSGAELERIIGVAEDVCRRLGIPHRVVQMCTGDLGFVAARKYDIEMWAPGCNEWLEVSSCSNCTDFQARRANIRFRREPKARAEFVHTLNGSALGIPRTMIAILENYQNADGSLTVPDVLRRHVGLDVIAR